MSEMWAELERYQPYAERHGFGDAWRRMTTERTEEAARAAEAEAEAWAAGAAAWAADVAGRAAWAASGARAAWAAEAIRYINEAIKLEES